MLASQIIESLGDVIEQKLQIVPDLGFFCFLVIIFCTVISYVSFNLVNKTVLSLLSFSSSTSLCCCCQSLIFWIVGFEEEGLGVVSSAVSCGARVLVIWIPPVYAAPTPHSDPGCAAHPAPARGALC